MNVTLQDGRADAFLGLGANLGDPEGTLRAVRELLAGLSDIRPLACSAVYRTEPVGGPSGQPEYRNAAVAVRTGLTPEQLLDRCLAIEDRFGRQRRERWAARSLDIDLLLYRDQVRNTPRLTLPHPRLHLRRFVLEPLCELAPGLVHPVLGQTLATLLTALEDPAAVRRLEGFW